MQKKAKVRNGAVERAQEALGLSLALHAPRSVGEKGDDLICVLKDHIG